MLRFPTRVQTDTSSGTNACIGSLAFPRHEKAILCMSVTFSLVSVGLAGWLYNLRNREREKEQEKKCKRKSSVTMVSCVC